MPTLSSPPVNVKWALHLYEGGNLVSLVVSRYCTLKKASWLVKKLTSLVERYQFWMGVGGEAGCYEMDEIFEEARRLAGSEFDMCGSVRFYLVSKELNQSWQMLDGKFLLVEPS